MAEFSDRSPVETLDIPAVPPTPAGFAIKRIEGAVNHSVEADQTRLAIEEQDHDAIGDAVDEHKDSQETDDKKDSPEDAAAKSPEKADKASENHSDEPDRSEKDGQDKDDTATRSADKSDRATDETEAKKQPEVTKPQESDTPEPDDTDAFGDWFGSHTPETPEDDWMFGATANEIDIDGLKTAEHDNNNDHTDKNPEASEPETEDDKSASAIDSPHEITNEASDDTSRDEREHASDDEKDKAPENDDHTNDDVDSGGSGGRGNDKPPRDGGSDESEPDDDSEDEDGDDAKNPQDENEELDEDSEKAGSEQVELDDSEEPLTIEDVYNALKKVFEKQPDKSDVSALVDGLIAEVGRRGVEVAGESDHTDEAEATDDKTEQGDRIFEDQHEAFKDDDESDEEPELSAAEQERQQIWDSLEYHGPLHDGNEPEYPPDSIAAHKIRLDKVAFEMRQLEMDSMLHPEHAEANDARLEELDQKLAEGVASRAKEAVLARLSENTYLQFTPDQLKQLREVAVEELVQIDPRAAGSAGRRSELLSSITGIDRTLSKWEEVKISDNPLERAMQLGRVALESILLRGADVPTPKVEDAFSQAEARLRGRPIDISPESRPTIKDIRRRFAGRAGAATVPGAHNHTRVTSMGDRMLLNSFAKRMQNEQLEDDLQGIEHARKRQVPLRQQAARAAIKKADEAMAELPKRQIRGVGNVARGVKRPVRNFGDMPRKTADRPRTGGGPTAPKPVKPRKVRKQARRELHAAQSKVREARAKLNEHKAVDRLMAHVPLIGAWVVPKTVIAQANLEQAVWARDSAAESPHLKLPAAIGRYIG